MVATGASSQVRIEYVKSRRALRLTAGDGDGTVEVPLAALISELRIDRRDLVPQARVLLFGGTHDRARGGSGDLIGWFETDADGRAAFREVRATRTDDQGWAELVALGTGDRPTVLAWFGRPGGGAGAAPHRLRAVPDGGRHPAGRVPRRHLRLLRR